MQSDFIVSAVSVAAGIVAVMLLILMTIGSVYEDTKKEAFRDADASQCQARKPVMILQAAMTSCNWLL
eukprot:m.18397 g.18397  ORF g.18397 m.18397 type:complete len:68 (+) comp27652_c0_seq4:163-366(+)